MKNRVMIPALAILLAANTASSVWGAEYVIGADFSPTFRYSDNVQLSEDEEGSFWTEIRPTLTLSRAEQNSQISFQTGLNVQRYTSLSRLDREDPFASVNSSFNTERSSYGLSARYSENAQREIAEEDTGNFASNTTVTSKSISPRYQFQLTEKDSVYANLNYSERTYGGDGGEEDFSDPNNLIFGNNFSDNETTSLTSGWQRAFTERFTGGVAITYAKYEAESSTRETEYDTYNYALTGSYLLSEKWSMSGQVGYRTLENEIRQLGTTLTDESSGSLFSLTSTYQGETNDVNFVLARSLSPSGEGVVNEQDRVAVNWNRALSDTLSFALATSYQQTRTADDINNSDRDFLTIAPSLNWRLKENLALKFGYQYRQQKGTNFDAVDSNMVFFTVGYDWDGWRFSR